MTWRRITVFSTFFSGCTSISSNGTELNPL
jgi:hypothetical protein